MCLSLIPMTATAAEKSPWTGRWREAGQNVPDIVFWQDGNKVIGAEMSGSYRLAFEGTVSGNVLTGTAAVHSGGEITDAGQAIFTLSADGRTITCSIENSSSEQYTVSKITDYSELERSYEPTANISFTGIWIIPGNSDYGGEFIVQSGDKATLLNRFGTWEGTVSGNVLSVTCISSDDDDMIGDKLIYTMSADGMNIQWLYIDDGIERDYYNDLNWKCYRLSPITYVKGEIIASDWAKAELEKADKLGLIPESLKGQDLAKSITRAEFAAVSVKAYEVLANTTALPVVNNPFTDTTDVEVLKAFNVGITTGVSADKFEPNTLLNREQAATMLTRVFKRATISGWTIGTDGQFTLQYTKPAPFADDADISDWAKDSVYFMVANEIIRGVGDNKFAPKNTTGDEEARGYANATREQALIIAVRMIENLKDKPANFQ